MPVGPVKFFNTVCGFGVVEPDGGNKASFVRILAVQRAGLVDLREGQRI
jgi:CspA family cold shock protein